MRERISLRLAHREGTCRLRHLPGYPRDMCSVRALCHHTSQGNASYQRGDMAFDGPSREVARHAPVAAVARMMDLGESTGRRYDIEVLEQDLPAPTLNGTASVNHR